VGVQNLYDMHEVEIRINVKTENKLSFVEIFDIMGNMKARLQGYHTEVPECMVGADVSIDKKFLIDAVEHDLYDEADKVNDERDKAKKN